MRPSYTANFFDVDLENIRAVRHGDVLAEEDTDLFRAVAHGSDGSRSFFYFHAHFTVNANAQTTVNSKETGWSAPDRAERRVGEGRGVASLGPFLASAGGKSFVA